MSHCFLADPPKSRGLGTMRVGGQYSATASPFDIR
jgi:hypothetical protein